MGKKWRNDGFVLIDQETTIVSKSLQNSQKVKAVYKLFKLFLDQDPLVVWSKFILILVVRV